MKPIGIFYGSSTGNCEIVATIIKKKLNNYYVELHDIYETNPANINEFDNIIFGVSTWGIGEFQEDWDEFVRHIVDSDLKNKVVALYGLGDQGTYADSFCDGLGMLYDLIKDKQCKIVGQWPVDGYNFTNSKARNGDFFCGLVIDEDVQPELTRQRVHKWLEGIIDKFL